MKANAVYTVKEILTEAGFEKVEEKLPKYSATISGIIGIVDPDKTIEISPNTKELFVALGEETATIKISGTVKERIISEAAHNSLENYGATLVKEKA